MTSDECAASAKGSRFARETRSARRRLAAAAALLLSIGSAFVSSVGCTALQPRDEVSGTVPARVRNGLDLSSQQVALDFANAIRQIEALAPERTLLQFVRDDAGEPVLDALREMLAQTGYGIRRVDSPADVERLVTHRVVTTDGAARQHEVSIGRIGLRRSYRETGTGRVRPASALLVKGADANAIRMMDDVLFGLEPNPGGEDAGGGERSPGPEGAPAAPALPGQLLASYGHLLAGDGAGADDEMLQHVSRAPPSEETLGVPDAQIDPTGPGDSVSADGSAPASAASGGGDAFKLAPVRNVRELGRSNYADTLAAMSDVVEHLVDFPRGSDRLDARDVALIDDVLARFDADTDLIAVTGYSVGRSPDIEFNRAMALQRARRVRDAFTAVGVPVGQVLVEGVLGRQPPRRRAHSCRAGAAAAACVLLSACSDDASPSAFRVPTRLCRAHGSRARSRRVGDVGSGATAHFEVGLADLLDGRAVVVGEGLAVVPLVHGLLREHVVGVDIALLPVREVDVDAGEGEDGVLRVDGRRPLVRLVDARAALLVDRIGALVPEVQQQVPFALAQTAPLELPLEPGAIEPLLGQVPVVDLVEIALHVVGEEHEAPAAIVRLDRRRRDDVRFFPFVGARVSRLRGFVQPHVREVRIGVEVRIARIDVFSAHFFRDDAAFRRFPAHFHLPVG